MENELRFWRNYLADTKGKTLQSYRLRPYFADLIGEKKEVDILDVGSGPFSTAGYTWPGVEVRFTQMDILADEYGQLFDEYNITPFVKTEKQDMVNLTYADNTFDIVNCRNALDHCASPFKAVQEMVRVCKIGGWIYFWHYAHMGKISGYHGFHQWNIDGTEDGDCLFWNKQEKFLLSECVPGFITEIVKGKRRTCVVNKMLKTDRLSGVV